MRCGREVACLGCEDCSPKKAGLYRRIAALETQLAEERAKRETISTACQECGCVNHLLVCGACYEETTNAILAVTTVPSIRAQELVRFRERALRAERELAVAEALVRAIRIRDELAGVDLDTLIAETESLPTMKERAARAERELAEERHELHRVAKQSADNRTRAEKAEARVKELETQLRRDQRDAIISWFDENKDAAVKQIGDLNGVLEKELTEAQARVAELQALVDAATAFRFGNYEAQPHAPFSRHPYWWVSKSGSSVAEMLPRDRAIAHASDLAAKEKEPTQ